MSVGAEVKEIIEEAIRDSGLDSVATVKVQRIMEEDT